MVGLARHVRLVASHIIDLALDSACQNNVNILGEKNDTP